LSTTNDTTWGTGTRNFLGAQPKFDAKAGTITVQMTDRDGKTIDKTFRLIEEFEYADGTGRVAILDILQSGDEILFVEADGTIQAMKRANKQEQAAAKDGKRQLASEP
jgi:hypothetical protein